MKTELKTAIIFGIVIAVGVGILSGVFSSLDQTTNIDSNLLGILTNQDLRKHQTLLGFHIISIHLQKN